MENYFNLKTASHFIEPFAQILKWSEIEDFYNKKYGKNHHHLRLKCSKCGNEQTCRCSTPKVLEIGICPVENKNHLMKS